VNIPLETIFAMLAIEMFRSLGHDLPLPATGLVTAATGGWIVFQYVLAASLARRTRRRLLRGQESTVEVFEDFRFRLVLHRVVLVMICFAHIYFTRWPTFVEEAMGLPAWSVLDDVASVAPFVAAMVAGWLATYRADKMLSRRPWGIGEYVWFQTRYSLLLVLVPWLVLKGIDDSRELWPGWARELAEEPYVSFLFLAGVVVAAAVYLPVFLKWLFRARTMPPSEARGRLESVCRRAGLRFRDILVWRMERARILNAGVMGILPRYRYVLFSDALLDSLSPAEGEAVLAHEIGHVKHRHVLVYLLFTLGFVVLAYDILAFLPRPLKADPRNPSAFLVYMPILAILVSVYFRFVFGYLSRQFERQADVYAAGLVGSPVPLILALEKIALISGDIRQLSSWRHYSVAERVRFLSAVGYEEHDRSSYHARTRRVVWVVGACIAAFFAVGVWLSVRKPDPVAAEIARWERAVDEEPGEDHYWVRLGEELARVGEREKALEAFREALRQNPRHEGARAGLRSLGLPTPDIHRVLALSYMKAGYADEPVEAVRAAVERDPSDPRNLVVLASLLVDADFPAHYEPQEAIRLSLRALKMEKSRGEARVSTYETLVRACLEAEDRPSALQFAREGLETYPADRALGELLERAAAGAGLFTGDGDGT
jgi:Zn-dependent protease with chaperone function